MQFLSSIVGASSLPYTLTGSPSQPNATGWTACDGVYKANNEDVTVFSLDKKAYPHFVECGRNALKMHKTLRHPYVLGFVEGDETSASITIITERVETLNSWLLNSADNSSSKTHKSSLSWGLCCVLLGLEFLSENCKLIHGNISPDSIYCTKGGDWKIGGLFLCEQPAHDGPGVLLRRHSDVVSASFKDPLWLRCNWRDMVIPLHRVDMYAFTVVLYYALCGITSTTQHNLDDVSKLPSFLRVTFKNIRADAGKCSFKKLKESKAIQRLFKNKFVQSMLNLSELSIKSKGEKQFYLKELTASIASFPTKSLQHKVLPVLEKCMKEPVADSGLFLSILPAVLQIGSTIEDPMEYKLLVVPPIKLMLLSNDRQVRVSLLQRMNEFEKYLEKSLVEELFPKLCTGFRDTTPILRELTLKAMLLLAPKLSATNLNDKLMRCLVTLQNDPEPSIVTNTVICMTRLFPLCSKSTQQKLVIGCFTKASRAKHNHTRKSGLKAISNVFNVVTNEDLVGKIMPCVCLGLNDADEQVRTMAFKAMRQILTYLEEKSKERAKADLAKRKEMESKNQENNNDKTSATNNPVENVGEANTANSMFSKAAGWAFTGITSKLSEIAVAQPTVAQDNTIQANTIQQQNTIRQENPMPQPVNTSQSYASSSGLVSTDTSEHNTSTSSIKGMSLSNAFDSESDEDLFGDAVEEPSPTPNKTKQQNNQEREERRRRLEQRRKEAKQKNKAKLSATRLAQDALKNDDFFNSF